MNFGNKVAVGICLALLAFASIGVFSYNSAVQEEIDREWVTHTHDVLEQIDGLVIDIFDAEVTQRGYLLTGEESSLRSFVRNRTHIAEDLRNLRQLTSDSPIQQRNLDKLEPIVASTFAGMQHRIEIREREGLNAGAEAVKQGPGNQLLRPIREITASMEQEERRLRTKRMTLTSAASARIKRVIVLGNALALLFLAIAGFVIQK